MKNSLSILIPAYNGDCRALVDELCHQADAISGLSYEVIVADDGSPDASMTALCREVERHGHCRFIARQVNVGRAAIRNFLAREARYEWLLFIDCDMAIISAHYLKDYLACEGDVVYGGYRISEGPRSCLRYIYEKSCEQQHTAEKRRQRPFQHFHTSNFMVRCDIMAEHPFDERFRKYGYEDVFFGKQLRRSGIGISHIDNPTGFHVFEENSAFVAKTEEGLETLQQFRAELQGYSQLLTFVGGIHLGAVRCCLRLLHKAFRRLERRNLCGRHPSLRIFKLYKLGYFLSLDSQNR